MKFCLLLLSPFDRPEAGGDNDDLVPLDVLQRWERLTWFWLPSLGWQLCRAGADCLLLWQQDRIRVNPGD